MNGQKICAGLYCLGGFRSHQKAIVTSEWGSQFMLWRCNNSPWKTAMLGGSALRRRNYFADNLHWFDFCLRVAPSSKLLIASAHLVLTSPCAWHFRIRTINVYVALAIQNWSFDVEPIMPLNMLNDVFREMEHEYVSIPSRLIYQEMKLRSFPVALLSRRITRRRRK